LTNLSRRDFNYLAGSSLFGLTFPRLTFGNGKLEKKIVVGQVGTAHSHASAKMETIRKMSERFEVVGVVESDPDVKRVNQKKFVYTGLKWMSEEELLNLPGLEGVLVETDLNFLIPSAMRCIEAGKHIHLDKPPGKSLGDLKTLMKLAADKQLIVQIGYMFRYNPAFQFCLQAVAEGWLGQVFEVDGVISKVVKPERRQKLAENYGGSMMLLGCHLIDILVAICGKPNRVMHYSRQTFPDQDTLNDNELAVFEYENGVATVRSTLNEVEGKERRQFVVCGTNGTIEIKPLEPPVLKLTLDRPSMGYYKGLQIISLPDMPGRYDDQLLDFAGMVRGNKVPEYTFEHDIGVHETLLQACGII